MDDKIHDVAQISSQLLLNNKHFYHKSLHRGPFRRFILILTRLTFFKMVYIYFGPHFLDRRLLLFQTNYIYTIYKIPPFRHAL